MSLFGAVKEKKAPTEKAPTIDHWDNELPTLIFHGIDDECDSGFINMIKHFIYQTGENSNKKM